MKRFEFRLDRVLEWRQTELDLELAGLGRLTAEAQAIDRRRAEVEAERSAAEQSLVSSTTVEAQQLAALDAFRAWALQERVRLVQARTACETRIGEQRQRVLEARRRLRLLEKLKGTRKSEWEAEFSRETENLAGELYLARRARPVARST